MNSKWTDSWMFPLVIMLVFFFGIIAVGVFVDKVVPGPGEVVERTTSITFSESGGNFRTYVEEDLKKEWKNVTFVDSYFEPTRYQGVRDIRVRFKVSGPRPVKQ